MNKKTCVFGVLSALISTFAVAQEQEQTNVEQLDEVVVTDSRFELKRENSGKTVVKISKETIEKNQGKTVSELINTVSGIEINGSRSAAGQNLGVYVRGGRNRQVLVIIDGVQVSDPSQLDGSYDFRLLNLGQIESIEIIKGAASTLYGSGAAAAVINITTKKASTEGAQAVVNVSMGTNQSKKNQNYNVSDFSNGIAVSGTSNKFTYKTAFNHQFTDGLSAAITDANEKDPFSKYALDVNLGYAFSKSFSLNIFGNLTNVKSSYDAGAFADAPNVFKSKQKRVGFNTKYNYNKGSINVNAAFSDYNRDFISNRPSTAKSKNYVLDAYNKYVFNDTFYTVLGVNVINSETVFAENKSFNIIDPYANMVYVSDFGLNINAGGRLNNHSEYGSHFTYNINPSYVYKFDTHYTKLFGSFSTSFITPSLSQLFGKWGPNPNLKPEEDRTIEAGIEYSTGNTFRVSTLYFNRAEKNTILWLGSGYFNATEDLHASGVEIELSAKLIDDLTINANYSFTEHKEVDQVRIPKHKVNLNVDYSFSERTNVSASYQFTHHRLVNDFRTWPATPTTLKSFSLVNLYASHALKNNKIKFFVGLDNLLNEDYEDVLGFTTKGRNARLGFQLTL